MLPEKHQGAPSLNPFQRLSNFISNLSFCNPKGNPEHQGRRTIIPRQPSSMMEFNIRKTIEPTDEPAAYSPKKSSIMNRIAFGYQSYATNQTFILGKKKRIVAKLTTKIMQNYDKYFPQQNPSSTEQSGLLNSKLSPLLRPRVPSGLLAQEKLFLFENQTPDTSSKEGRLSSQNLKLRESIATYLANRLKCDVLIEALCGLGNNTRQFVKHCQQVIALDIDSESVNMAKKSLKAQDALKVDFLHADYLKTGDFLKGDIVFLDPTDTRTDPTEKLSLFKHFEPALPDLLAKSLQVSSSIALKLPSDVQIEEIPELFGLLTSQYQMNSKRFCIEIEEIQDESLNVECIMLYFGDCSAITAREEFEVIYDFFLSFEDCNPNGDKILGHSFPVAAAIFDKIGVQRLFRFVEEIEEELAAFNITIPLYDLFLEKVPDYNSMIKDKTKTKAKAENNVKIPESQGNILNSGNTPENNNGKLQQETHEEPGNSFLNPNDGFQFDNTLQNKNTIEGISGISSGGESNLPQGNVNLNPKANGIRSMLAHQAVEKVDSFGMTHSKFLESPDSLEGQGIECSAATYDRKAGCEKYLL